MESRNEREVCHESVFLYVQHHHDFYRNHDRDHRILREYNLGIFDGEDSQVDEEVVNGTSDSLYPYCVGVVEEDLFCPNLHVHHGMMVFLRVYGNKVMVNEFWILTRT